MMWLATQSPTNSQEQTERSALEVNPPHRIPEVVQVVVRVVLLRVGRRVPQLGLHLLPAHPEALLAVRREGVPEPLEVGALHAGPHAEGSHLVERAVADAARFPRLLLVVREDPGAGLALLPLAQHLDQPRGQTERGLT